MFSYLRRCAVTLTRLQTSKLKVMRYILRSEYTIMFNLRYSSIEASAGIKPSYGLPCVIYLKLLLAVYNVAFVYHFEYFFKTTNPFLMCFKEIIFRLKL